MSGKDETVAMRRSDAETRRETDLTFTRRALTASGIAAGVVVVVLLLWYAVDVLLLVLVA